MSNIRIVFLGGQDEMFKNMVAVEIDNDIFIVECGVKFPDKTKHGIDYIIPKYDYLILNKNKVRAYFITEGNDTVMGALPYIYQKVPAPIVCSDVTRVFLYTFCEHNRINPSFMEFKIVDPSEDLMIAGHEIRLFSTTSNLANSFGVSFTTDQGNIIFALNFVIDNNSTKGFVTDLKKIGTIANKPTLALFCDSISSDRSGYSNPQYKLVPRIAETIHDAQGRIFISLETPDVYNIIEFLKYVASLHKKVVLYDESAFEFVSRLIRYKLLDVPADLFINVEDINRVASKDLIIAVLGFGRKLLHKISILACGQQDNKIFNVTEGDIFILGNHFSNSVEIDFYDAVDDLYRAGANVLHFRRGDFITVHPSVEDIKTILSTFRPSYYVPISGNIISLLSNAQLAVGMGIGLNHTNVLIVDNGMILTAQNGKISYSSEKVMCGDVMIDGNKVAHNTESLIAERCQISDDGIVILACAVSREKQDIISSVDIQTRGLVYAKDSDTLFSEIEQLFTLSVKRELQKETVNFEKLSEEIKLSILQLIRRHTLKTPLIIVNITEIK